MHSMSQPNRDRRKRPPKFLPERRQTFRRVNSVSQRAGPELWRTHSCVRCRDFLEACLACRVQQIKCECCSTATYSARADKACRCESPDATNSASEHSGSEMIRSL